MNRKTLSLIWVAALAGTTIAPLSGAATPATSDGLVSVQSRTLDELYMRPNVRLSQYQKIIVDPAQASLKKNWLKDINAQRDVQRWLVPEDAQRVRDEAATSMGPVVTEAFKTRGFEVATAPGPGVLRLTPSVTDLYLNAPDTHDPGIQRYVVRDGGQATLLLEMRDSVTGELIGRVVDRGTAREIRLNNRATGVSNLFWFEAMFREWAGNCAKEFQVAQASP
jgi:hypothetical protein